MKLVRFRLEAATFNFIIVAKCSVVLDIHILPAGGLSRLSEVVLGFCYVG